MDVVVRVKAILDGFQELEQRARRAFSEFNVIARLGPAIRESITNIGNLSRETQYFNDTALKTWASTRGWRQSLYDLDAGVVNLVGTFLDIINTYADFDTAVRTAASSSEDFSYAVSEFNAASIKMGESTKYSAQEAATALQSLAMAGLTVDQSVGALPVTMALAQAGAMSLGDSADIVTNIMSQYSFTVGDLQRASDVLTKTFTATNSGLSDLSYAFIYSGTVAKTSNMAFEETNAMLGTLANNGYKSGKAGRALANTLVAINQDRGRTKAVFDEFNVKSFDEATGKMRPLVDILDDLDSGMKKAGPSTKTAGKVIDAFGKVAGPGILAVMSTGAKATKELEARLYGLSQNDASKVIGELYTHVKNLKDGIPSTNALADRFKSLGVDVQDSFGSLKRFPQLLAELKGAGVQADQLKDIFPDLENIDAISSAFAKATPEVASMEKALAETGGTTQLVADQMVSGLGGAIDNLSSAWESLQIAVVEGFSGRIQTSVNSLTDTLSKNKATLADFISKIFEVIVVMAEWGIKIFAFVANNQILLTALGLLIGAFIAVKYQFIELTAVMLGKFVVTSVMFNGAIMSMVTGIYTLIVNFSTLSASTLTFSSILSKLRGYLVLTGVLMSGMLTFVPIIAALAATWYFLGDTIKGVIQDVSDWFERNNQISQQISGLTEQSQKLNTQLSKTKIKDMGNNEIVKFRQELLKAISTAEGLEVIGELSKDEAVQLAKNKELLKSVNTEIKSRPDGANLINQSFKLNDSLKTQKDTLENISKDVDVVISQYDQLYASMEALKGTNIDQAIERTTTASEELVSKLEKQPKDNTLQIANVKRGAILANIALEKQRFEIVDNLIQRESAVKQQAYSNLEKDDKKVNNEILKNDQDTLDKRIQNNKNLFDKIKQALDNAKSDYKSYTDRVLQLEENITNEKARQKDLIRNIERQGMSDVDVIADKKKESVELTAAYEKAMQEGNLQKAIEIAKKQESLAQDIAAANIQVKESEIAKQKELKGLTDAQAANELASAKASIMSETKNEVVLAQQRINTAMEKEKEIAIANANAQKEQVDILTTALNQVSQSISTLQEGKIDIAVSVVGMETVTTDLESLKKPIETKLVIKPSGETVQGFLDMIGSELSKLKSQVPSGSNAQGFNTGALVPGVGNSDTVPAMLTPGEFVVRKARATRFAGLLNYVNFGSDNQVAILQNYLRDGIQRLNIGGPVLHMPVIQRLNTGGNVTDVTQPQMVPVANLYLSTGKPPVTVYHPSDTAASVVNALQGMARGRL